MNRPVRWYDYISINVGFMGLSTLSQAMLLVMPLLVQQFVGEANKGAYMGQIRLWSLMVALLVQALMGMLSDHSTLPWGRRRPFILIGTLVNAALLVAIGFSANLSGESGYWIFFCLVLLMSVASNTTQGPLQALIPDLAPGHQRGRFSGVKAFFEVPLPLIFSSLIIGWLIEHKHMWIGLLATGAVLIIAMLLTMLAPEQRQTQAKPINWQPFLRLALMTGLFTLIILGFQKLAALVGELVAEAPLLPMVVAMTLVGLAAIALTVGVGVWLSVRLSIGSAAARENPSFTWWVINRLGFIVGSTNLASFAVYFFQGRLGLEREAAAGPARILLLIVGVSILLLTIPSGWLADRLGHKRIVLYSGLAAALGVVIILLTANRTVIYLGGMLVGSATGLFYMANWALGTQLVPKDEAGRYLGISNLAGAGAGAVGAYIGGPIADFITQHATGFSGLGYVVLFGIYGLMFLLSTAALLGVKIKS
jgi:MFS family permease